MKRALEHPLGTVVCAFIVLRAALRVAWLEPASDLDSLVERLRNVPRSRLAFEVALADGIIERVLFLAPPWRAGRCVKRSLIQLDVWSRAGGAPRLHLGVLDTSGRGGHVWVSNGDATPAVRDGIVETWSA